MTGDFCSFCKDPTKTTSSGTKCPSDCDPKKPGSDGICICSSYCHNFLFSLCCDDYEETCATKFCTAPWKSWLKDGHCDTGVYNTEACGWDGGDCCATTCDSAGSTFGCLDDDFDCKDPAEVKKQCSSVAMQVRADGKCDDFGDSNTKACQYDGGDCCESTCKSTNEHNCGEAGYTCRDPHGKNTASGCDVGQSDWIGDGFCDSDLGYNTNKVLCDARLFLVCKIPAHVNF